MGGTVEKILGKKSNVLGIALLDVKAEYNTVITVGYSLREWTHKSTY